VRQFPVGFTMGTVSSSQGSCAAFPCTSDDRQRGSATISVDYTVPSSTLGLQTNTVSVAVDGTTTGDTGASDDTSDRPRPT